MCLCVYTGNHSSCVGIKVSMCGLFFFFFFYLLDGLVTVPWTCHSPNPYTRRLLIDAFLDISSRSRTRLIK